MGSTLARHRKIARTKSRHTNQLTTPRVTSAAAHEDRGVPTLLMHGPPTGMSHNQALLSLNPGPSDRNVDHETSQEKT